MELVFGLVAPVGAGISAVGRKLEAALDQFRYCAEIIKVTDLLAVEYPKDLPTGPASTKIDLDRLNTKITLGTRLRREKEAADIFGAYAVKRVRAQRQTAIPGPHRARAYIIHQLKRPEEIEVLRRVYGNAFFVIGVHKPREERIQHLESVTGRSRADVIKTVTIDEEEKADDFGQRMADAFQMADLFITEENADDELVRFLDVVFDSPHSSPRQAEQHMFLAYAAALRSADLARQVGALIASPRGEVLGIGSNDVPRFGGGQYWAGKKDKRDHQREYDSNVRQIEQMRDGLVGKLTKIVGEKERKAIETAVHKEIKSITEYGRSVHAEMEALLHCLRVGTSPRGGTVYTTTFPCHNCAKHLIGAGIRNVVYVEPYPKSLALTLHDDSARFCDDGGKQTKHVAFRPYLGIGARRFIDLFSNTLGSGRLKERRVKGKAEVVTFTRSTAESRFGASVTYYDAVEASTVDNFEKAIAKKAPRAA